MGSHETAVYDQLTEKCCSTSIVQSVNLIESAKVCSLANDKQFIKTFLHIYRHHNFRKCSLTDKRLICCIISFWLFNLRPFSRETLLLQNKIKKMKSVLANFQLQRNYAHFFSLSSTLSLVEFLNFLFSSIFVRFFFFFFFFFFSARASTYFYFATFAHVFSQTQSLDSVIKILISIL